MRFKNKRAKFAKLNAKSSILEYELHKTSSGILVNSKAHWGIIHTWQKVHWSQNIFPS